MILQSTTGTLKIVIPSQQYSYSPLHPLIPPHIRQLSRAKNAYSHRRILRINGGRIPSPRLRTQRATPARWRRSRFSNPQNGCRDLSIRRGGGPSSPLGILCRRCWEKPRKSLTRWRRRGRRSARWSPCLRLRGSRHGVWLFGEVLISEVACMDEEYLSRRGMFRNSDEASRRSQLVRTRS